MSAWLSSNHFRSSKQTLNSFVNFVFVGSTIFDLSHAHTRTHTNTHITYFLFVLHTNTHTHICSHDYLFRRTSAHLAIMLLPNTHTQTHTHIGVNLLVACSSGQFITESTARNVLKVSAKRTFRLRASLNGGRHDRRLFARLTSGATAISLSCLCTCLTFSWFFDYLPSCLFGLLCSLLVCTAIYRYLPSCRWDFLLNTFIHTHTCTEMFSLPSICEFTAASLSHYRFLSK